MSTIRADYISPSAGGTTKSLVRGTASAWVNFDGTGTIAARDSENVSSLTDVGTGFYTINFSSAFAAADYACNITSDGAYNGTINSIGHGDSDNTGIAAGLVRIESRGGVNSYGGVFDTIITTATIHGDLA